MLFAAFLELFTAYATRRFSETFNRVSRQYADAMHMQNPGEARLRILLVGNSLLEHGVDVPALQRRVSPDLDVYPIFLEATAYYDWVFGLDRLFRNGVRPDYVIVGLPVNSLMENAVRADYTPMLLFDAKDVLHASRAIGLDRTDTSNLLLAHYSFFWDMRSDLRTQVLRSLIPHSQDAFSQLRARRSVPDAAQFQRAAEQRLINLQTMISRYGIQLAMLFPPVPDAARDVENMVSAANEVHVESFVPVRSGDFPLDMYESDGFHLNARGANAFTSSLADELKARISKHQAVAKTQ